MFRRKLRLQEVIRQELAQMIEREIDLGKDVLVTVSKVEITPDLSEAKVFISVLPDKYLQEALLVLKKKIGFLQRSLNKVVNIKRTPKIIIKEDKGMRHAARVEEILEQIKKEKMAE